MARPITLTITDALFSQLQRRAKDIGGGCKAEDVALDWLEHHARSSRDLAIQFRDTDNLMRHHERVRGTGAPSE